MGVTMNIGPKGLALIKRWEGLKLTAYLCPAKVWTVGYGSTGKHVKPGMTITEPEAEALLRKDLARFEQKVSTLAKHPTQEQFDAMVALAFNIGEDGFARSSVLKAHNAGDFVRAAQAFGMWVRGGGRTLKGLVNRRADEAALYRAGS